MTGATGGFLYVPGMTGAPASSSGPTGYTGTVAHVFDVSNNMPWYLNPVNTFGGSTGATPSWVAGNGQVLIQKVVLGGATGTVTFSGIPQVFNHLRAFIFARQSGATNVDSLYLQFNGDSGTNYDWTTANIANGAFSGVVGTASTFIYCGVIAGTLVPASYPGTTVVDIPTYTNTTFFKSTNSNAGMLSSSAAQVYGRNAWGTWRNTSAISSVTLLPPAGNFITGSLFYLYGVW